MTRDGYSLDPAPLLLDGGPPGRGSPGGGGAGRPLALLTRLLLLGSFGILQSDFRVISCSVLFFCTLISFLIGGIDLLYKGFLLASTFLCVLHGGFLGSLLLGYGFLGSFPISSLLGKLLLG